MNNLNTSEIKRQAGSAFKQNPGIILSFLLFTIINGVISSVLGFIPVVGIFAALFATTVLQGMMMLEIEEKSLGDNKEKINDYAAFVPVFLITVFAIFGIIAIMMAFIFTTLYSTVTNGDVFGAFRWATIMYIIILVGSVLLSTCIILPKTYIAAKYNNCSKEKRKEIMNTFKENGLFKRALLLELSIIGEMILLYILGVIVILVAILTFEVLIFPVYLIFIIAMLAIFSKLIIARVILYRELSGKTEY